MEDPIPISKKQLTEWADTVHRINHLETLVQRELGKGDIIRAADLSERARKRAWTLLNELFDNGAGKPENYCEPTSSPDN